MTGTCPTCPTTSRVFCPGFHIKVHKESVKNFGIRLEEIFREKREGLGKSNDCSGATRKKAAPHGSNRADPHMSHTHTQNHKIRARID